MFIDDAENGLDTSNSLLPYLESFIERFVNLEINTHIVIATTRNVHYSAHISSSSSLLRLKGLDDDYIEQSIESWLMLNGQQKDFERLRNTPRIKDLVSLVGGYPLAAKLAADSLAVSQIEDLVATSRQRTRFQLKFAAHILRSIELTPLETCILQVLTTVDEPMSLEDIRVISEVQKYSLEDIREAKAHLVNLFLIEQDGEILSLHNFIKAFYRDELRKNETVRDLISREFGEYALVQARNLTAELNNASEETNTVAVSNDIFRYAVSAGRLLRRIGEVELAKSLSIQIEGTIREMVYYFYQDKKDYGKALEYAQAWVKIDPEDLEIKLYQARCHRNIGLPKNLEQAQKIIGSIEKRDYNKRFQENIYREKALISEKQGNDTEAKMFFRKGIEIHIPHSYPGNHIGLAQLLLREADNLPYGAEIEQESIANEALELLEVARKGSDQFDQFHLQTYVQALVQAGKEEQALPLLEDALKDSPNDDRLNYRMGEIKRKHGEYDEAIKYAEIARQSGYQKAILTIANSIYGKAIAIEDFENRNRLLYGALSELETFRPEYGQDIEIADSIKSKIYRELLDPEKAYEFMSKYESSQNPYTIYEIGQIFILRAQVSQYQQDYSQALVSIEQGIEKIDRFRNANHKDSTQIINILLEMNQMHETIRNLIESQ